MITLNPYLVYNGNCEEAFVFYKEVFRTAHLYIARYGEAPEEARKFFAKAKTEKVLHATLKINENTVIMGNDNADPSSQPNTTPKDFYLYIDVNSPKEATRIFNELSAGGKMILPIAKTFWSPCYGVLTDRFGINWKVTSHQEGEASV